jgi:hypothetical protein
VSSTTSEDPKELANYRFARAAAIILGILIVIALVALILGFAFRSSHAPASASVAGHGFAVPPGARLLSMDVEPGRIIFRLRSSAGEEIDVLDTQDGHLVAQVKVPSGVPPR